MARRLSAKRAVAIVDRVETLPDVAEGWANPWHDQTMTSEQSSREISDAIEAVKAAAGRDNVPGERGLTIGEAVSDFAYDGDARAMPKVYGAIRDRIDKPERAAFDQAMEERSIEVAGGVPTVLWYGRPANDVSYLTLKSMRDNLMLAGEMGRSGAGDSRMAEGLVANIPDQMAEIDAKYLVPFGVGSVADATDGELSAIAHGGYQHAVRDRSDYADMCRNDPEGLAHEVDRVAADLLPLDRLARYDYDVMRDDLAAGNEPNPHLAQSFDDAARGAQRAIDGADEMARSGLSLDYADGYGIVCAYDDDPEHMIDTTLAERDRAEGLLSAFQQDANSPETDRMLESMATGPVTDIVRPERQSTRQLADFDDDGFTDEPEDDFDDEYDG